MPSTREKIQRAANPEQGTGVSLPKEKTKPGKSRGIIDVMHVSVIQGHPGYVVWYLTHYLSAFTCIPAILNEYRTAELNVRTGCLKALTFVFEYVGPQSAYYADSVVTMLEDALTDRDLVHRQTASTIVKHLALGVAGLGCEDSMLHLMNLVWPNCFETSPHVIGAVMEAIEAMRVTLGPGVLLSYVLQGLFHPARKVREVYWRIYNALYLGASDALVPFYPDVGELSEGKNVYERHYLQAFI